MPDLPKYAVHKVAKLGKMTVEYQHGKDHFMCRTGTGEMRLFHRGMLTFTNKE